MMRYAKGGDEARIHFAKAEGAIPSSDMLERMGIKVFFGVGHETTGCHDIFDDPKSLTFSTGSTATRRSTTRTRRDIHAGRHALGRGCRFAGDDQVLPVHAVPEGDRRHIGLFPVSLTPQRWPSWKRTRRNHPGQSRGN
jgi:hypothetical protein